MADSCLPLEELLALAENPAGDPRWDHVCACPRCRGRLAAYGLFKALDQDEPCPGEEAAVPRLSARVRSQLRPARRHVVNFRWYLLPAVGAAAVVAGVLLLREPGETHGRPGAPTMRERPMPVPGMIVATQPVRELPDGSLELLWEEVASADAYRVRILDTGLNVIDRLDAGRATRLVLGPDRRHAGPQPAAFWQVEALLRGDRIADSTPMALPRDETR